MSFEKDYIEILKIIKFDLGKRKLIFIKAEDVIADAFILMSKKEYSRKLFLRHCQYAITERIREKHYTNKRVVNDVEEKKCFTCKKDLHISNFGITKVKRFNGEYRNANCKGCINKKSREWDAKNKQRARDRILKFKRNARKNLTDYYIIQLLSKKYEKKHLKKHYYLIENTRDSILKKRHERTTKMLR